MFWRKKFIIIFFLFLLPYIGLIVFFKKTQHKQLVKNNFFQAEKQIQANSQEFSSDDNSKILGVSIFKSKDEGYNGASVIALTSTEEPAVYLGALKTSGIAEIAIYQADINSLLDYLKYDKEGKQIKENPNLAEMRFVTSIKQSINYSESYHEGVKTILPLEEVGIWYLKVKFGESVADSEVFIVRSNTGILTKEGNNELIFWGQDFKSKKTISEGSVKILNLQDEKKELQTTNFNKEGIAKTVLDVQADIALIQRNQDIAIVPINLKHLNWDASYKYFYFQAKKRSTKYFIFTDRPLYKPEDTVFFKTVLRDDDDANYSIPQGEAIVKIYDTYLEEVKPYFEKSYPISLDGTIYGKVRLPAKVKTGEHRLIVSVPSEVNKDDYIWNSEYWSNRAFFNVEFFNKPEFAIEVTTAKTEIIAGDESSFTISGNYFSGQSLANQKVEYTIYSSDFFEYQHLIEQQSQFKDLNTDYRFSWYGGDEKIKELVTLDKNGKAEINLNTKIGHFNKGKTQVFTISAVIDSEGQTPSFAQKNILIHAGEYGIYRKDVSYGVRVNTSFSLPIVLVPYRNNFNISNVSLVTAIHRENWVYSYDENKKDFQYKKEEEDLPRIEAKTDNQGEVEINFTPTKVGSYTITVSGLDSRRNSISKVFYSYVTAKDEPFYTSANSDYSGLTITADKQKYQPTDIARFDIFSSVADRDVFLSFERARVNRFQIIHLNGKSGTVEIPLISADVPNIYAKVSSFSDNAFDSNQTNIIVSSDSKKLVVNVIPEVKTFGPGETVNLNVTTADLGGNPVSADLALWAVDKAIFELTDNNVGNIFNTFWEERFNSTQSAHSLEGILTEQYGGGGGCFARGTQVLMSNGTTKKIEDVKSGDYILTRTEKNSNLIKAKVLKTHSAIVDGYLILNNVLKVTANHIIRADNNWQTAGNLQIGHTLVNSQGKQVKIESIEWQRGKFEVYNLEIEKYHTYFTQGIWVHNEKGEAREIYKDTAYWNPSVHTDSSGRAKVSFILPDNLTTWVLAAVGSTTDTKVGQTTSEIIVTKDIIVRPILPNILRQDDDIILSALVSNYTLKEQVFDINLKFDSGSVKKALYSDVLIKSNQMQQFYWQVKPTVENNKAKLTFSAKSKNDSKLADIVIKKIPVRLYGFEESRSMAGEESKNFSFKLSSDSYNNKSKITLALAPTIIGTLSTAMKYLIKYPYGCVEQTTSRFVPAVIAKANKDLFTESLKDKDINDIIERGLSKLKSLQQADGGWGWWSSGKSDYFITAYVVEYILQAKQTGIEVDEELIKAAQDFLEYKGQILTKEDKVTRTYPLTLLNSAKRDTKLNDLDHLSPDLLSLAVISNYLNGDGDPQSNGLNKLISMAKEQNDVIYWEAGNKNNFGSKDASTALAIRAILLTGGDRNLALKGARYLLRFRKSDYWSNTFATAQVIRALVDLSRTGSELTPNYEYTVTLDNQQIAKGKVGDAKQIIKEINIPAPSVNTNGSNISIVKKGEGQLYSVLTINEFHTDKNAQAKNNGLEIRREYLNQKDGSSSLNVGDTAIVKVTVNGLSADENYGVINDELPAGLVPINQSFKNEQYGDNDSSSDFTYGMTDYEITENGMVLSLHKIASGENVYTYKARVVSSGVFTAPPASVSLMYIPEVNGRSEAQIVKIGKESAKLTEKQTVKSFNKLDVKVILIALIIIIALITIKIIKVKI